jgi:hypothetical protein
MEESGVDNVTKKILDVGPGGIRCSCCAPAPGSHARKKLFRQARRKAKELDIQERLADIEDCVFGKEKVS